LVTAGTLPAGGTIATAWAVSGLVVAVVPAQLAEHRLGMWAGPVLFLVNAAGVLVQPWARRLAPQRSMLIGLSVVPVGYALMVTGAALHQLPAVLLGACICGTGCYGFSYLGGLAAVSDAAGEQRARAVAGFFFFAYLGFGIPSILVGYAADHVGTTWALSAFGSVLLVASGSLALLLRRLPGPRAVHAAVSPSRAQSQMT
jgi:MFS family permease